MVKLNLDNGAETVSWTRNQHHIMLVCVEQRHHFLFKAGSYFQFQCFPGIFDIF